MQKAAGLLDAVPIDEHTDHADAEAVHQDRQRNRGCEDHDAQPGLAVDEVGHDGAHAHEREQITQAAAGLGNFELVAAEVDDITFEVDADAEQADERHTDLRRDQLQVRGNALVQKRRQRIHQQQQRDRYQREPERLPAHHCEYAARNDDDERVRVNRGDCRQRS